MNQTTPEELAALHAQPEPVQTYLDPHHAAVRLALSEMTGAATAVLHAIYKAGGHVIADPQHQQPIADALRALGEQVHVARALPSPQEVNHG